MRAQRAQARAKQMRQNLFGSNLLNMSMYNAQQAGRSNVMPHHPGAQYAMNESYIPMGYDLEGRPVMPAGFAPQEGMYPPGPAVEGEMYRLPPIDNGMMNVGYDGMGWHDGAVEYWDAVDGQGHQYETHPARGEYYHTQAPAGYDFTDPPPGAGYRLPPLLEGSREGGHTINMGTDRRDDEGVDPRMTEWSLDGQQTPSGHVLFNERLFEGALGSAGLQQDRRDEGLVGFDEAIAQVNEVPQW